MSHLSHAALFFAFGGLLLGACITEDDRCELTLECGDGNTITSSGGTGATGANGGSGPGGEGGGGGGSSPCGDCPALTPLCDEATSECVACFGDGDCTEPGTAKCEAGACVPCDASLQCAGVPGAEVCDAGTCVECALGEEDACTGGQTCDLLAKECVDVGPLSVQNCLPCSNDLQCAAGHRCIPMDFDGSFHGYYCLEEPSPTCDRPYAVFVNQPSISGAAAQNYCGLEEDLATCEAVRALVNDWHCTGTDGMCSPLMGEPEVAVPGALCEQVGALANRCTYACAGAQECPTTASASTCGQGPPTPNVPPGWCGG